jgi:hypothetical protein
LGILRGTEIKYGIVEKKHRNVMIQDVDLQSQMSGESDRAYLAYKIYRDMSGGRTVLGAYVRYIIATDKTGTKKAKNIQSSSPHFRNWTVEHCWDDRVKDWDNGHAKRLQSKLIEADQEKYINSVDKLRGEVEAAANELMNTMRVSNAIARKQLMGIAKRLEGPFKPMPRNLLTEYSQHTNTALNSAKILVTASEKLSEALGLERIITELNKAKVDK